MEKLLFVIMKRLLLTGASGFVGNNILPILSENYQVTTCGRSEPNDVILDLSCEIPSLSECYDIVLHAAGKAHEVPSNVKSEKEFYDVNVRGTANLCKGLEIVGVPHSFIFISSVAVYGCEEGMDIDENHPLNGNSPYARSKILAEDYLKTWCLEHDVVLTVLRPSLIAGPNPPGNLGAMIRGIKSGRYLRIAGGKARKSILMVDDIAKLVPLVENKGGIFNICSDENPSLKEIERMICSQFGKRKLLSIPYFFAKLMAMTGDLIGKKSPINTPRLLKITRSLTFCNEKAKSVLGWKPLSVKDFCIE